MIVNKKGFTVIELISVLLIIGLLSIIAIPMLVEQKRKTQQTIEILSQKKLSLEDLYTFPKAKIVGLRYNNNDEEYTITTKFRNGKTEKFSLSGGAINEILKIGTGHGLPLEAPE